MYDHTHLYTTAVCPVCGVTFNKHVNAVYCSKRCANKVASQRRFARYTGAHVPLNSTGAVATVGATQHHYGTTPLSHQYLANLREQCIKDYVGRGEQGQKGSYRVVQGGGKLTIYTFDEIQVKDFFCAAPVKLERILDRYEHNPTTGLTHEVYRIHMGHEEAFKPQHAITNTPAGILDLLKRPTVPEELATNSVDANATAAQNDLTEIERALGINKP
jgi:hypothetical protein